MTISKDFVPPKIWQWQKNDGSHFSSTNRPIAGATQQKELPQGKHPLQLYSMGTPNGVKVTILLEELLALGIENAEYDAYLINISEGDQFTSGFVDINPNSKIPALIDMQPNEGSEPIKVFESASILLYLAEKFDHFIPKTLTAKTEMFNWLFWQMGSAPFLGGGFGHFYAYAPKKFEYPINRYAMEVKRQLDVLDKHLANHDYLAGNEYSIADMATYPWYGELVIGDIYQAQEFLSVKDYVHVMRWAESIKARIPVQRGRRVNVSWGDERFQVPERHCAEDIS